MSSIVNKVKEALHSDKHEGTHSHNNRESDLTGSRTTGGVQGENFTGQQAPEGTYGHHNNRMANAADPRIDSDNDGSRTMGTGNQYGSTGNTFGSTGNTFGTTGRDEFGTTGTGRNEFGTTGTTGTGRNEFGSTGDNFNRGAPEGTFGPHSSRMANAADPRVDSDRDGSRTMNPGYGSGPAPNTAGPHKSDMLNKADPRIDSDLDGSRTLGNNNNTYNA